METNLSEFTQNQAQQEVGQEQKHPPNSQLNFMQCKFTSSQFNLEFQ